MTEQWKPISGYEGIYEVSSYGRVRSLQRYGKRHEQIRKLQLLKSGYQRVTLYKNGKGTHKRVHRLVLEAFIGPCPEGMVAYHIDSNPLNNKLSNLKWETHINNIAEVIRLGNFNFNPWAKKKEAELNAN